MTTTEPGQRRRQHQIRHPATRTTAELAVVVVALGQVEGDLTKLKAKRDRLIRRRFEEGATIRQIATESGVSRPRVQQIVDAGG